MKYNNRHLVEVSLGFQFPDQKQKNAWDSTYLGRYFEKIKDRGFESREERRGVQISLSEMSPGNTSLSASQSEEQIIFRNPAEGRAIMMGRGLISFHILQHYAGWNSFFSDFIVPFYESYLSLGLGTGQRHSNMVYLNRFDSIAGQDLSEMFTLVSPMDTRFGKEIQTSIQRVVRNDENLLITKFNTNFVGQDFQVLMECGAINGNPASINGDDWKSQAEETHRPVSDFFEEMITPKLRSMLC